MAIHESGQMYLETIYILSQRMSAVRAIDVGEALGYSKPSVSRGLAILRSNGFVTCDANGHLTLTPAGLAEAQRMYERHTVLSSLLMRLGVSEKTAVEDACRMEHVISDETFQAIRSHLDWAKAQLPEE